MNKRRDFIKKASIAGLFSAISIDGFSSLPPLPSKEDSDYWQKIRDQFLLTKERTYLNAASLGPSPKVVVDAINEWNIKLETICETGHKHGIDTNKKVAKLLNVDKEEIAITRNTTEGINIMAQSLPLKEGDEVIITKDEHVGGAMPWMALMKKKGIKLKLIDLDYSGKNNLEIIKKSITDQTKAVAFSHVTCSTGMILPAKEIIAYCRSKNIYTCVDGAQAAGMIDVDLKELNPDFYATSGHKWLFGPKGTGILFINKKIIGQIDPIFVGAYSDKKYDLNKLEFEYLQTAQREEYGTRNIPIIIAFGTAIDLINSIGIKEIERRGKQLASLLKQELAKNANIELLTPIEPNASGAIVTFKHKRKDFKEVQDELHEKHKFRVRGIYENKHNAIRISCSIYNSEGELKKLVETVNNL